MDSRRGYGIRGGIVGLLMFSLWGCNNQKIDPVRETLRASKRTILNAREEAISEGDEFPFYRLKLRINPVRCGCPEVEIFYYGIWNRVYLTEENESDPELIQLFSAKRDEVSEEIYTSVYIQGKLTGNEKLCERGHSHPIFALIELL